jgi:hypothetical protein
MRWLRPRLWRLPWLRRQRLRWLQGLRGLPILPLRRRLRWLWWLRRWLDRRAGGMHRVLRIMGPLPLVLDDSAR